MAYLHFVFYLHWALMVLLGVAGLSIIFKPFTIARLYMIAFLGQQLILNGCIMTMWENKVKVAHGWLPNKNEFIVAHIGNGGLVVIFKAIFIAIIVIQMFEMYLDAERRKANVRPHHPRTNPFRPHQRP